MALALRHEISRFPKPDAASREPPRVETILGRSEVPFYPYLEGFGYLLLAGAVPFERSWASLSFVMKTVSAMVAGMLLLRRTPEAKEYGVLVAIFPAPPAAGRVERELKMVLASSLSLRHLPKRVVV